MLVELPIGGRPVDEHAVGASKLVKSLSIWILDGLDERRFEFWGIYGCTGLFRRVGSF
jgi:hypothetical protein